MWCFPFVTEDRQEAEELEINPECVGKLDSL